MTEIDQMFASLVVHLFNSMKEQLFDDVKCFITDELVVQRIVQSTTAGFTPFFSYNDIEAIKNLKDLLFFLNNYWSFFNLTLLEKFVKRFGSKEAKKCFANYLKHLQKVSVSQLPTLLHHGLQIKGFLADTLTVKMKSDFLDETVGELLLVHDKVAQSLHVQKFALLLQKINKEKCHLEFLVPANTRMKISPLSVASFYESSIHSFLFQGSELTANFDDDDNGKILCSDSIPLIFILDFDDGDSGVGATTDQSDTESLYQGFIMFYCYMFIYCHR